MQQMDVKNKQELKSNNFSSNDELDEAFRKYLREIKLDKSSPHFLALKYLLAKVIYPHVKIMMTYLNSIVCPFEFPSFATLIDTVAKRKTTSYDLELVEKLAWALDELVLKPDDFGAVIRVLLSYSYKDNLTTQLLQSLVKKVYQKAKDKNSPELHLVINRIFLALLQVDVVDRARNFEKIAKLCAGLSSDKEDYTALIATFTIEQLQWLFYRLLAFENTKDFLRGTQFAVKLSRFVMNEDQRQLAAGFNDKLDKIILIIIKSNGPLDLELNNVLAENLAAAIQEFLNWLTAHGPCQIQRVSGLCALIYNFVSNHPNIEANRYSDYVSGFLILRFVNSMIMEYKEKMSERLQQEKFKGLNITPEHLAFAQKTVLLVQKLTQAIATKSERMTEHEKVPSIQALRSPENITKLANWILKIAYAKEYIHFKVTAMDHCYYDVSIPAATISVENFIGCTTLSPREVSEETLMALGLLSQECAVTLMLRAWFDVCNEKYKLLVSKPNLTLHKPLPSLIPFSVLSGREEYFNPIDKIKLMLDRINKDGKKLKGDLVKACKGLEQLPVYTQEQINQKRSNILESIAEVEAAINVQGSVLGAEQMQEHQKYLASLKQDLAFHLSLHKYQQLLLLVEGLTQLKQQCEIFVKYKKDARSQIPNQNLFASKMI